MKNKTIFCAMLLGALVLLPACKAVDDVDDQISELSEVTFSKLSYCGHVSSENYKMNVIQYHLNHANQTVERKTLVFGDMVETVSATETFQYSYGDFAPGNLGRYITISNGAKSERLTFLNNTITQQDGVVMEMATPAISYAEQWTSDIPNTRWAKYENTVNVMQDHWCMDTTWYETHRVGKKITVDTITGRYRYADKVNIGMKSTDIVYLTFLDNAENHAKTAVWAKGQQVNKVDTIIEILPQVQDPTKNDTIITMKITPNTPTYVPTSYVTRWGFTAFDGASFTIDMLSEGAEIPESYKFSKYLVAKDGTVTVVLNKETYYKVENK